jgi:hypothetical protein
MLTNALLCFQNVANVIKKIVYTSLRRTIGPDIRIFGTSTASVDIQKLPQESKTPPDH